MLKISTIGNRKEVQYSTLYNVTSQIAQLVPGTRSATCRLYEETNIKQSDIITLPLCLIVVRN